MVYTILLVKPHQNNFYDKRGSMVRLKINKKKFILVNY